ncbi:MAG TPA: hypothetical protein DDY48_09365 [Erwinia persicina]|nr:hypothetical protein [Erwinia persicina]
MQQVQVHFTEPSAASHFSFLTLSLPADRCKLRAIVASPGPDTDVAGNHGSPNDIPLKFDVVQKPTKEQ